MGRAAEILKHASHIKLTVAPVENSVTQKKLIKPNSKIESKKNSTAEKKQVSSSPKVQGK
jgi:hypothetical protein